MRFVFRSTAALWVLFAATACGDAEPEEVAGTSGGTAMCLAQSLALIEGDRLRVDLPSVDLVAEPATIWVSATETGYLAFGYDRFGNGTVFHNGRRSVTGPFVASMQGVDSVGLVTQTTGGGATVWVDGQARQFSLDFIPTATALADDGRILLARNAADGAQIVEVTDVGEPEVVATFPLSMSPRAIYIVGSRTFVGVANTRPRAPNTERNDSVWEVRADGVTEVLRLGHRVHQYSIRAADVNGDGTAEFLYWNESGESMFAVELGDAISVQLLDLPRPMQTINVGLSTVAYISPKGPRRFNHAADFSFEEESLEPRVGEWIAELAVYTTAEESVLVQSELVLDESTVCGP